MDLLYERHQEEEAPAKQKKEASLGEAKKDVCSLCGFLSRLWLVLLEFLPTVRPGMDLQQQPEEEEW